LRRFTQSNGSNKSRGKYELKYVDEESIFGGFSFIKQPIDRNDASSGRERLAQCRNGTDLFSCLRYCVLFPTYLFLLK
jgi:hypothetical protein